MNICGQKRGHVGKNVGNKYHVSMENTSDFVLRNYHFGESERASDIRGLKSKEERAHFKNLLEKGDEWTSHYMHLALVKNDELIGDIQLRRCFETMPPGVAHVGMDVLESFRGQGAGTRGLELVWEWALRNNFHRLEGSTDASNIGAQKAFMKAGWNFEGTLKNLFVIDGIGHDFLSYAKTR